MIKIRVLIVLSLIPLFFLQSCKQALSGDLIITNVNIIDVKTGRIDSAIDVVINSDKITSIVKHQSNINYQAKTVIDGSDKFLIPGLFDCHVHTNNFQNDFPKFIHYGVTSIFVTGGSTCTNDYYKQMRDIEGQDSIPTPRVFHTSQHFIVEGSHPVRTYSSSNWVEGETVFYLKDTLQIEALVKQVSQYPIQGIKLTIEDGPMPPPVPRMPQAFINKVTEEAKKNNTKVFVHISDNEELRMALEAKINNFLHYTGVDIDFEKDKVLVNTIYKNNVSWVTTLMLDKSFIYPLHPEWINQTDIKDIYSENEIADINNPIEIKKAEPFLEFFKSEYGLENPSLKNIMAFQVEDINTLLQNGVNMVLGTDTGNDFIFHGHSLHEEMQLLELGGMQPEDILKMGTYNAAKMMDVLDSLGTIEEKKIADLVLLNKNPMESIQNTLNIHTVIKNGIIQKRIETN
jgi:imidazolonepropionase-like amidohydrolase